MTKQKPFASIRNPKIQAILNGLYSFKTELESLELIDELKKKYQISNRKPQDEAGFVLWIKGFNLSEIKEKGYVGNFVEIFPVKKDDKFSVEAKKIDIELKYHPERKYQKKELPSWGHPVLRNIKKGKKYNSLEQAKNELIKIQEDYKKNSIP